MLSPAFSSRPPGSRPPPPRGAAPLPPELWVHIGRFLPPRAAYAFARTCRAGAESWAGRRHGLTFAEVRERVDEHFQVGHFQIGHSRKRVRARRTLPAQHTIVSADRQRHLFA